MFAPPYRGFDHISTERGKQGVKRSTHEMLAGLTGHIYPTNVSKSVMQFLPTSFIPALYRTTTGRDFTVLRWDPLHIGTDG